MNKNFKKRRPLKIFFCDLTYDTIILVSDTIPINIGFIASYAKKKFENEISVQLFKYPNTVIEALKNESPDLICLSNYSWNSNLSEHISSIAKRINPNVIVAQGGPNFPHDDAQQIEFMKLRPSTDIFMIMEGEITTTNIINRIMESNLNKDKIFETPINGAVFLDKNNKDNLFKGNPSERIKILDDIPSPYLNGLMDHFFDGKLTPFLETNRGCPFKCSFCHTGNDYFQKIHMFSTDRVNEEIQYIAKRAEKLKITNLHLADTNFGMYPRDREITKSLLESHLKYKWPMSIMSTTGKNNKARVIDVTDMLGNMFSVNMSAQSMDENVLKNIKRSNISLDDYISINDHLKMKGRSTKAELIMPLPGETKESFIKGVDQIISTGVSNLTIYTLMILYGTEFKNPDFKDKHGYEGKFRIVPLNFGEYGGEKVFDYEEVGIKTNDISFNDYLELRALALMVETLLNGRPFDEFFLYASKYKVSKTEILKELLENIKTAPPEIQSIYNDFLSETSNELWDSEKDLLDHYKKDDNYKKLKAGLVGGNLIYKYKVRGLVLSLFDWLEYIEKTVYKILLQKKIIDINAEELDKQLTNIKEFCKNKLSGIFDYNNDQKKIISSFDYDILKWLDNYKDYSLSELKYNQPKEYTFGFTDDQITMRQDHLNRYGSDLNALSKVVTRISNLESLFRKVKTDTAIARDIYTTTSNEDRFTRYTLAN